MTFGKNSDDWLYQKMCENVFYVSLGTTEPSICNDKYVILS